MLLLVGVIATQELDGQGARFFAIHRIVRRLVRNSGDMLATVLVMYVTRIALGIFALVLAVSIGGLPLSVIIVALQTWILAYVFGNLAVKFVESNGGGG